MPNNKQICTWKDCDGIAAFSQYDKNGKEWANLCDEHNEELDAAVEDPSPKAILRAWVLASGGAKKITDDMFK